MSKQWVLEFFKPSPVVVSSLALLVLLAVITGYPWDLSQEQKRVIWYFPSLVWLFLTLPLLIISWATVPSFLNPPLVDIFTPVGAVSSVVYYYLLSCVVAYVIRSIKWDNVAWKRAQGIQS